MKYASVRARYQPNDSEVFEVTIDVPTAFPDVIREAEATATRMMDHMIEHAIKVYATKD